MPFLPFFSFFLKEKNLKKKTRNKARYYSAQISSDKSEYEKLKNAGCLLQLNLLSTVGYYGESITKITNKLLEKGFYDFVGSDVHHDKHIAAFEQNVKIKELTTLKEIIANNQFFRLDR